MEPNFIREYKNVITPVQCQDIISFFNDLTESQIVHVADGSVDNGGAKNRVDSSVFLERCDRERASIINQVLINCWDKYVQEFTFLGGVTVSSYTQKLQKTPPSGGFHTWHWEHNGDHDNRNRLAVWTLYLTTHENEGETEFLAHGLRVAPEAGKLCIFPADYTAVHRGNPVYSKDKYIITGWFEYANS